MATIEITTKQRQDGRWSATAKVKRAEDDSTDVTIRHTGMDTEGDARAACENDAHELVTTLGWPMPLEELTNA